MVFEGTALSYSSEVFVKLLPNKQRDLWASLYSSFSQIKIERVTEDATPAYLHFITMGKWRQKKLTKTCGNNLEI